MRLVASDDHNLQVCAQRLIALIELLMQTRPTVVLEIERSAQQIVTNDVRQQITERLQRFSAAEVRLVEALTDQIDQQRLNGEFSRDTTSTDED